MVYATVEDVEAGFKTLDEDERARCEALLKEAGIIIDTYNLNASIDRKNLVSCRMVRRGLADNSGSPIGATQGSMSALGYTQSWTMSSGSVGELYLSKTEKTLLGVGNRISAKSPIEEMQEC